MLSQQPLVRYNQTMEYSKKDLEVRLKEVVAVAMVLKILFLGREDNAFCSSNTSGGYRVLPNL